MFSPKILIFALYLAVVQSRYVYLEEPVFLEDGSVIQEHELVLLEEPNHPRVTRQVHGVMSTNPDGSTNIQAQLPIAGNSQNVLSAIASGSGLRTPQLNSGQNRYDAASGGLQLDNVNGHSLSVMKTHIPSFGDQLTAAGKVNLLHTQDHNLNANAFVTRNMPSIAGVPDFNTHGGGLNYMFKDKIGGSLGVAQTPLFQKTDLSAMGNLNLFKNPSSSLDFSAGASRSMSPFIPKSSWQPTFGLSFSRSF